MAVYPCDYDRRRYRAAQQSIYWTQAGDNFVSTYKMRLCPEHFDELADSCENRMTSIDDAGEVSGTCDLCDQPRSFGVSVRVYRARTPEAQYVIDLCTACCNQLGNDMHVYNGTLLDRG